MNISKFKDATTNIRKNLCPKGKETISPKIVNGIVYSFMEDASLVFITMMSIKTGAVIVMVDNKEAYDRPSNSPVCLTYPLGKRKMGSIKQLLGYLRSQKGFEDSMTNRWSHKKFNRKDFKSFSRSHILSKK